jgi:hypothetical protein
VERGWKGWLQIAGKGYFSEPYGLFLDGAGATLCEYWYLMNVTAMAYGLIQLRFAKGCGVAGARGEERGAAARTWRSRSNTTSIARATTFRQEELHFTNQDIYRQPDAVGGYSYVMLLAWKLTGNGSFAWRKPRPESIATWILQNPWYEVPSGAMAVMAAARLEAMGYPANARKALGLCLDSKVGLMAQGDGAAAR